ncbi:sialate O-acetylesterase [Algibacter mikhailovii]|uniref:sialate O-acetylesterase n=1 Tax=Algibacter mikhailovii TaxID=425498 RepID=UPI00249561D5|nr:sialate O-acetylesterase [Algibacter mikhailovii]
MKTISIFFRVFIFLLLVLPTTVRADVSVNALFSDHMVIQRETIIPIWGWADPFEKVEVKSSWGESAAVVAGADGKWKTNLKTPKAGGPFQIIISGNNKIIIDDVLSGEVWLCTGQSNMDFAIAKFLNNAREAQYQPLVEYMRAEVASANDDYLRHIEVPQTTSLNEKKTNFKGQWVSANSGGIKKITATGYFFAKELRSRLHIPIGLVECSWGGTRVQPWISKEAYLADENLKEYFEVNRKDIEKTIKKMDAENYTDTLYEQQLTVWKSKGSKGRKPKSKVHPRADKQAVTTLYNGMLHAIIPFAIKGAIWYQGESNAVYMPNEYEAFLTTMISSWRLDWGQGDFPFYWTQLAACQRANDKADKGWATVNDQLRRALKLPNTGMAVLYDVGEAKDIHPHNKMDAGKRMALWALERDYNIRIDAISGPLYKSNKIKGNKIVITFDKTYSGLMTGYKHLLNPTISVNEPLKWFEIVGTDGVWQKAEAKIISKKKVEVWNATIANPKYVRYAWSGTPDGANLYNIEGLPAAVFTTEQ